MEIMELYPGIITYYEIKSGLVQEFQYGKTKKKPGKNGMRPCQPVYLPSSSFAWAAASRAIGTRGPEQET